MHTLRSRLFAAAGLFVVVTGCSGGESSGPKVVPVETVAIVGAPANLEIGTTVTVSAQAKDAAGAVLPGKVFTWSSNATSVATVGADGAITAVGIGTAIISATTDGKSGSTTVAVIPIPVASVTVTLAASQITIGQSTQATAVALDASGRALPGKVPAWSSAQPSVATVDSSGKVTGVSAGGPISIIATIDGRSGFAQIVVTAPVSCSASPVQMAVGEIRILSGAERSSFCLGSASPSEFVLIPFNSSPVSGTIASLQLVGTNTSASAALVAVQSGASRLALTTTATPQVPEYSFRVKERDDLAPRLAAMRRVSQAERSRIGVSMLTGMPETPVPGSVYPVNVNLSGNTCTGAKVLRDARVVSVTSKVIVMIDTLAPSGGYTDPELASFGETFESIGFAVTTLNFGTPSDIDGNSRVVVLFTHAVNALSGTSGGIIGGLHAARDLFPVNLCVGSNEGEMFYMPVPDPANSINSRYTDKAAVSRGVQGTLSHELQHLINAGRRIYVNDAFDFEEVWLNEGLSHIAEELAYYQVSGNAPRQNIGLSRVQSSQAQVDAINGYQVNNLGRLVSYLGRTETNSPYAQNDSLATRGATWELLRYAADRKGGDERAIWFGLANSRENGQTNFAATFGNIVGMTRDWAITQYFDDTAFPLPPPYTYPSWNFRTLLPAINSGVFPLLTRSLTSAPLSMSIVGGGAGYVRFVVNAGLIASVSASSSGLPPVETIDLVLVRIQ